MVTKEGTIKIVNVISVPKVHDPRVRGSFVKA